MITRQKLDMYVEIYKGGVDFWSKDQTFLEDCAYYEGKIKKASELLNIPVEYSYLNEITPDLQDYFSYGYNSVD